MSTEQPAWLEALRYYIEVGAAEAARRTGIPSGSIAVWAMRAGLVSVRREKTRARVEAAALDAAALRLQVSIEMLQASHDFIMWAYEETTDYVGQAGREVRRKRPPAADIRNLLVAAGIALDKHELLSQRPTGRTETTTLDAARNDHERALLRAAIEWEAARRGESLELPADG